MDGGMVDNNKHYIVGFSLLIYVLATYIHTQPYINYMYCIRTHYTH